MGLSDHVGSVAFDDSGSSGAHVVSDGEVTVNLTTLDIFWKDRTEKIGFIKCDTEGHGVSVLKGAKQTLIRHRPVVSFAIYHNFDEFFQIPLLLQEWLVNYNFQWVFGVDSECRWHECVFLGYPSELLEESAPKIRTDQSAIHDCRGASDEWSTSYIRVGSDPTQLRGLSHYSQRRDLLLEVH
jgi:hypothetical protein